MQAIKRFRLGFSVPQSAHLSLSHVDNDALSVVFSFLCILDHVRFGASCSRLYHVSQLTGSWSTIDLREFKKSIEDDAGVYLTRSAFAKARPASLRLRQCSSSSPALAVLRNMAPRLRHLEIGAYQGDPLESVPCPQLQSLVFKAFSVRSKRVVPSRGTAAWLSQCPFLTRVELLSVSPQLLLSPQWTSIRKLSVHSLQMVSFEDAWGMQVFRALRGLAQLESLNMCGYGVIRHPSFWTAALSCIASLPLTRLIGFPVASSALAALNNRLPRLKDLKLHGPPSVQCPFLGDDALASVQRFPLHRLDLDFLVRPGNATTAAQFWQRLTRLEELRLSERVGTTLAEALSALGAHRRLERLEFGFHDPDSADGGKTAHAIAAALPGLPALCALEWHLDVTDAHLELLSQCQLSRFMFQLVSSPEALRHFHGHKCIQSLSAHTVPACVDALLTLAATLPALTELHVVQLPDECDQDFSFRPQQLEPLRQRNVLVTLDSDDDSALYEHYVVLPRGPTELPPYRFSISSL